LDAREGAAHKKSPDWARAVVKEKSARGSPPGAFRADAQSKPTNEARVQSRRTKKHAV